MWILFLNAWDEDGGLRHLLSCRRGGNLETFSKALNAGQYPLSVLALSPAAAALYVTGVYGNTMTTCPRGLEVGCAVLEAVTEDLRTNIRERGEQLKEQLEVLVDEFGDGMLGVQGTGLVVNVELDPERFPVCGPGGELTPEREHHGFRSTIR